MTNHSKSFTGSIVKTTFNIENSFCEFSKEGFLFPNVFSMSCHVYVLTVSAIKVVGVPASNEVILSYT